jgi:integrase
MERKNFTKDALEKITPNKNQRIAIHDTKVEGLILRVEPSGRKSFCWLRKGAGQVRFKRIGAFPDFTVEQARGKASEYNSSLAKWAADDFQGDSPFERRPHLTLGEVLEHYIEQHCAKYTKNPIRTVKATRWQFDRYLIAWKDRRLVTIKQKDVRELHTKLGKAHGQTTANRNLTFLRTLFYHASSRMNWKGENPASNPGRNKILYDEYSRDRYLQPDEAMRLFRELRLEPNRSLRDFVFLSLLTGARKMEVLSMKWKDLNITQALWSPLKPIKRKKSYNIVLPPQAVEVLKERRERMETKSEWVFPSRGVSGHLVNVKKPWRALLKRAAIQEFRIHDLRRTLGSWMANSGASLLIIGEALGHQSYASTAPYARLQKESVRRGVEIAVTKLLTAGMEKTAET